ncbi:hypothetical protein TpMuguga_01g00982 [Theileria parva strain Muguga]|uniref:Uncharacterized protein n=1 Tax=Theileria parva TaxID=5875 RepID=Q4N738_THEPA|nr:uncharacterized protein TpMuguga_01g00982 [Theileria parva strain Muguga]EAN34220.1 hypothetical protein TpMuguga_01g00982 [Theileria parva strain Muguga]|eukprot:XP_766503.1 hypothetical protein [Theileria parva strain Muguga]
MSSDQDAFFEVALDLIASDLELLELSINDINIALGGSPVLIPDSYVKKVREGGLYESFTRSARNSRIYKCYERFKGLDLQVDSFFRILKLHLDRGFSFLKRFKPINHLVTVKLFCLCYVDVIFDLYYGVLKQVVNFTIHDCVYVFKFFSRLDNTLSTHRIKHVYVRDEIYDLILHALWFALKDAWWLYMDPKFIKPLFPFIAHMRVNEHYEVTIHDLNHVLHNIHFVTIISQDIAYQSETATVVDLPPATPDKIYTQIPNTGSANHSPNPGEGSIKYEDISESDLQIKYLGTVNTFGIDESKTEVDKTGSVNPDEPTEGANKVDSVNQVDTVDEPESLEWMKVGGTSSESANFDLLASSNHLGDIQFSKYQFDPDDYSDNFPNDIDNFRVESEVDSDPSWSQVIYVVLVGFIYIVLFESYIKEVSNSLNTKMSPANYVNFLIKRLQDVIQVTSLIVEVDCNFTAWARDKLGDSSDPYLSTCFNSYSDDVFSFNNNYTYRYRDLYTDRPRVNYTFSHHPEYKNDTNTNNPYISFNSKDQMNLYILSLSFDRAQKLQYDLIKRVSAVCSAPTLRYIDNLYFLTDSSLYREILYNPEKYLISPNGPLSKSCKHLPIRFKRAIFVETYLKIVSKYVTKVTDYESEPCEAIFFDSMSLWDSVLDFFDFSANPQIVEEECVKLVSNLLDRIKFTHRVDLSELNSFKNKFSSSFFTFSNSSESLISSYAYKCISFLKSETSCKFDSNSVLAESDDSVTRDVTDYTTDDGSLDEICLDKFNVWLDGVRKKRMLVFGNVILFFRDNSLLQPVGFISFDSIYSVLGPRTMAQVHPNVHILENNSENDSFSCGTSDSSDLSDSSEDPHPRDIEDKDSPNISNSYTVNGDMDMKAIRRDNGSSNSAKTSRRTSVSDNMMVWGWQVRLELLDSCVLEDFSKFDVVADFEFPSPENRKFWQQLIKDNPGTRPQFLSWPYHTFFFDSI